MTGISVLDVACGSKMMWFNRHDPRTVFADIRQEDVALCDGRQLLVAPDVMADFRALPFADNTFRLVVFDPPHLTRAGGSSWIAKKYGVLLAGWPDDLRAGFEECFRVLEPNGVLIFKWSAVQIPVSRVLELTPHKPLFGHPSGNNGHTHWITFMKDAA
jgi:ubiquinone/menaquinone biosynthesis C-methylase UbiE